MITYYLMEDSNCQASVAKCRIVLGSTKKEFVEKMLLEQIKKDVVKLHFEKQSAEIPKGFNERHGGRIIKAITLYNGESMERSLEYRRFYIKELGIA